MAETSIAAFIKYQREKLSLTQDALARKTGVGIHFLRDLEQGKTSLRLDKLNKVLALFGYQMAPIPNAIDPYWVWAKYRDRAVEIILRDKRKVSGFLVQEIRDERSTITAWKIVPFPNILQWQAEQNDSLTEVILHQDLDEIEPIAHEQIRKSLHE